MPTYAEVVAAAESDGGRQYDTIIDRALREVDPESRVMLERDLFDKKDTRSYRVSGAEMSRRLTAIGFPVSPGTVEQWRRGRVA